jgi:hypothetical protein
MMAANGALEPYMPNGQQQDDTGSAWGASDQPYIYWSAQYFREYSNHIGPDLIYGFGVVSLFPESMEIAWDESLGPEYVESDTSKKRLFIHDTTRGVGRNEASDINSYYIKVDEEDRAREMEEEMKEYNEQMESIVLPPAESFVPMNTTEEWPNGYEFSYLYNDDQPWTIVYKNGEKYVSIEMVVENDLGTIDGWSYFGVRVCTSPDVVTGDPLQQPPTIEILDNPDMAIVHSQRIGLGFTKELAEYLRDVMKNGLRNK